MDNSSQTHQAIEFTDLMHSLQTHGSVAPRMRVIPNRANDTKRLGNPFHNQFLISRLTDDILLEIFLSLYDLWSSTDGGHPRRSELAVCRKWRRIILATPVLWRKVSYPDAKPGNRYLNLLSFEYSKTVLLDLTIQAHPKRRVVGTIPFKFVAKHALRVRSLHVTARDIDDLSETFSLWGQLNTPNLRIVRITGEKIYESCQVAIPTDASSRLLGVEAWPTISALTNLILIGYSPFQFPSAKNLRALHVSSMKLTTKGLQDLVRQFPLLESLAIDKVHPWYNRKGEGGYVRDTIYMPSLRKLALGSGREHEGNCICAMGCIAAPNLELLELRCTSSVLNDDHFSIMLRPENIRHLQKIRLAVAEITLSDIPFLATLPAITDLELPQLDRHTNYAAHILIALLELTNFNSITLYFQPQVAPNGMGWASNCAYADKHFFCDIITTDQPEIGSPLCLRGRDADVKHLPPEVEELLGGKVRTTGLYEREPWIIPEWDSLQTYEFEFCDSLDDDSESGDEDDDYDWSDFGWDSTSP